MLKKYSDFINNSVQPKVEEKTIVKKETIKLDTPSFKKDPKKEVSKPEVKEPKVKEPILKENLNFVLFNGKIAKFPTNSKASENFKLLENNNIDKNKLLYFISEQMDNSLVIVKYNQDAKIKLNEFVTSLIEYYKRNESLKNIFSKIIVEGTEQFSIIKNIPNVEIGGKKLIKVLNDDLLNLLK